MGRKYKRKRDEYYRTQLPRPTPRLANKAGEEQEDLGKWVGLVFGILFVGFWIYWGLTLLGVFPLWERGAGWVP